MRSFVQALTAIFFFGGLFPAINRIGTALVNWSTNGIWDTLVTLWAATAALGIITFIPITFAYIFMGYRGGFFR